MGWVQIHTHPLRVGNGPTILGSSMKNSEATAGSTGHNWFHRWIHCRCIFKRLRSIEADTILYNSGISACVKGHLDSLGSLCLEMQRHCRSLYPSVIKAGDSNAKYLQTGIWMLQVGERLKAPTVHVLNWSVAECWGSKVETWQCPNDSWQVQNGRVLCNCCGACKTRAFLPASSRPLVVLGAQTQVGLTDWLFRKGRHWTIRPHYSNYGAIKYLHPLSRTY